MNDLPVLGVINDYIRVPEIFHSFLTGKPFEKCLVCECYLLNDGTQYVIEKAVIKTEVIFEFGICFPCHEKLCGSISKKSSMKIDRYFSEKVDFVTRRNELLKKSTTEVGSWIDECILTGKKLSETNEYQLYAHCDGPDLLFSYMPYMICGEGMDQIIELLSKETIGVIGDFTNEYLGCPPEFSDKPLLIL